MYYFCLGSNVAHVLQFFSNLVLFSELIIDYYFFNLENTSYMTVNSVKEVVFLFRISKHIREFLKSVFSFKFQLNHWYESQCFQFYDAFIPEPLTN